MALLLMRNKFNGCISRRDNAHRALSTGKLHYVVTDHQGTPREIFSEGGQASWAGRLNTWGKCSFGVTERAKRRNDPNYTECPFRFAGQYEDEESELVL